MKLLKKIVLVCMVLMTFSACSTVEGLGKDLKKGGQVLQNAAKKAAN